MNVQDVLARGYLPKELTPAFSSDTFAASVPSLTASVPRDWTSASILNLARPGTLRRRLSIPNPFSQLALVSTCSSNWESLDSHLKQSTISLSRPVPKTRGRALGFRTDFKGRASERLARMGRARFTLRADVSECYRSVYTHSLEWALHTKAYAKANLAAKGPRLLGGQLDLAVRNSQDGQTKGIPIGPDTSLLLAEIVLCAIDAELARLHPQTADFCIRLMDDLEFSARSRAEAEDVLMAWDSLLNFYDLALNPLKTSIIEGPLPPELPWRIKLSQFNIERIPTRSGRMTYTVFSRSQSSLQGRILEIQS